MYKGIISAPTALTEGAIIPFNTVWNTNSNTRAVGDGSVELRASGYYDVAVMVTVTGVTVSPISIQLFDGETPIAETLAETDITATTGIHTVNISDTIKVLPFADNSFARLSVRVSGVATVNNAILTIETRKQVRYGKD